MDELEQIPEIDDDVVFPVLESSNDTMSNAKSSTTKKRKRDVVAPKKKTKKKPRKPELVKRYLSNFDSSKATPPTEGELKSMTVAKLETLCSLQEKQQTHKLQPSGLAETLIGFLSTCLDFLAKTDGEITRLNAEDEELRRCVSEELGSLATYLNNKVKIASHVALNSGKAIVKKRRLSPPQAKQKQNGKKTAESTQKGASKPN
jgi:hypothetical protein